MTVDDGRKSHLARLIADFLLEGSGETWTDEQIYSLLKSEGWVWTGEKWEYPDKKEGKK